MGKSSENQKYPYIPESKFEKGLSVKEVIDILSKMDGDLECLIIAECGNFTNGLGSVRLQDDYVTFTSHEDMRYESK